MAATLQDRSVYEQLRKDYLNLRALACGACSDSPEAIQKCKEAVKSEVGSVRNLDAVQKMKDLLPLLERMNLLSVIKVEILSELEPVLGDAEFTKRLARFRVELAQHYDSVRRFYLEDLRHRDRRTLLEKEVEQAKLAEPKVPEPEPESSSEPEVAESESSSESESSPEKRSPEPYANYKYRGPHASYCQQYVHYDRRRNDILAMLTKELGRDWKTLGRKLDLDSATLKDIQKRHPKDVKARIDDLLEEGEMYHGKHFFAMLGPALADTRRKDLQRKLDYMLN